MGDQKMKKQLLRLAACLLAACLCVPTAFALDESQNGRVYIYYETCGGTGVDALGWTTDGGQLSSLPTPVMAGYTFDGWFTEPVNGSRVYANDTVFSADTTIYAQWTAQPGAAGDSNTDVREIASHHTMEVLMVTAIFGGAFLVTVLLAAGAVSV